MLIRKSSDVLREVQQVQNKARRKVQRALTMSNGGTDILVDVDFRSRRPRLAAEYEALQDREREAIKCAGKRILPDKVVERVCSTMRSNGLCPADYTQLFHLLEDIDPRTAVSYRVVLKQDVNAPINADMWKDAVACALAFKARETPLTLNSYFPFGDREWKDFYTLVVSYLLRAPTVEVTKVVQQKQATKTVILPVDQRLKDRYEALQAALQGCEASHRQQQRSLAASYNKAIRAQSLEIARLRAMLPPEAVAKLDAEPILAEELLPLPATGVTFVGASGSAARRLKEKYPEWDFVDCDEFPASYPDNPLCFFNTRWVSHKQYMHVKRWCQSNLLHCNLVGEERLEQEMQEAYTAYMRGKNTVEED